MSRAPRMQLPYADWPAQDRSTWRAALKGGDPFDEAGPAAHLADPTRLALRSSYGRFLGFVSTKQPSRLTRVSGTRIDRNTIADYVAWRRQSCGDAAIAIDLHHLRLAIGFICPNEDWAWLRAIAKRIAVQAPRRPERYHLVTSEQLYALGIELMNRAALGADSSTDITRQNAFDYRDGLLIALLALIPLRRRSLTALRIGSNLVKSGKIWSLAISAKDTKGKRALDYPISPDISTRIDCYLTRFRCRIPAATTHNGLWASNQGRAMDDGTIYAMVRQRTREAFGFRVNLHRFRHAAASLWSSRDAVNVRGAKDLLGHASFGTTDAHYIMAQSRLAGRVLARAIGGMTK